MEVRTVKGNPIPSAPLATASMPVAAIAEALRRAGDDIDDDTFDAIVALGPKAVPPLVALVRQAEDEPGRWLTPVPWSALTLLGHVADITALDTILDLARGVDPEGFELAEMLTTIVQHIGTPAVPGLLALRDEVAADPDAADALELVAGMLVHLECRDDRLLAALVQILAQGDSVMAAALLADFGDARAIPPLSRTLDALDFDPQDLMLFSNMEIVEIAGALQALGGTLTPAQDAKLALVDAIRHRMAAASRKRGMGRNDACWCKSGRKCKKCCLAKDEAV